MTNKDADVVLLKGRTNTHEHTIELNTASISADFERVVLLEGTGRGLLRGQRNGVVLGSTCLNTSQVTNE